MTKLEENKSQIGAKNELGFNSDIDAQVSLGKDSLISVMDYTDEEKSLIDEFMENVYAIDNGLEKGKFILSIRETRIFLEGYNLFSDRVKKHFKEFYEEFLLIFLVEKINQYLLNPISDKVKLSEKLNELRLKYPDFDMKYFYEKFPDSKDLLDNILKK